MIKFFNIVFSFILFSVYFSTQIEFAKAENIGVITGTGQFDSKFNAEFETQFPEISVETLQSQNCTEQIMKFKHLVEVGNFDAFVFLSLCPELHSILSQTKLTVPILVLDFDRDLSAQNHVSNIMRLEMPQLDFDAETALNNTLGTERIVAFAGYCDEPTFFQQQHFGPVSTCLERPTNGNMTQSVSSILAETAAALLNSNTDFNSSSQNQNVATPFGVLSETWTGQNIVLPGRSLIDVDHELFQRAINRNQFQSAKELASQICPDCSGTGDICGTKCPTECNNSCTKNDGKLCCRGDGMGVPEIFSQN